MSEIRLVTSSDEHLADLNPGFRKDSYRDAILRKLEWQGALAKRVSASAVCRAGDFFHVKAANKTTMATVALAAGVHRGYHCPTYAAAGNHDMSHNDPGTVPRQPIGVLYRSGVFRPLRDEILTSGTMKVRMVGVDYTPDLDDDALRDAVRKRDDDVYVVAFVHALASYAPDERFSAFFGEKVFDYRDLVFEGCPDAYVFAHYHKDQGVREHLGVQFVNVGAVSRGALTFENLERAPKSTHLVFGSRGVSVDVHEIPCDDPSVIFDLELKKRLEAERRSLEGFIADFRRSASAVQDGDVLARRAEIMSSGFPDDLKKVLLDTLEAAEAGLVDEE